MTQYSRPIKFACYTCKVENAYPALKGKEGSKSVIKRCINCGTENLIELPDGWIVEQTKIILRGLKPNEDN